MLFLLYLDIVLNWPEDGRLRPKHVAKYNLILIIASCLGVGCVLLVHKILYIFDNTQRDDLSLSQKKNIMVTVITPCIQCKLKIMHFLVTVYLRKAKKYNFPLICKRPVLVT